MGQGDDRADDSTANGTPAGTADQLDWGRTAEEVPAWLRDQNPESDPIRLADDTDAAWGLDRLESRLLRSQRADRENLKGRLDLLEQRLSDLDGRATALPAQLESRLTVRLDALAERVAEFDQRSTAATAATAAGLQATISGAIEDLSAQLQDQLAGVADQLRNHLADAVERLAGDVASRTDDLGARTEAVVADRVAAAEQALTEQAAASERRLAQQADATETALTEQVASVRATLAERVAATEAALTERVRVSEATVRDQVSAQVTDLREHLTAQTTQLRDQLETGTAAAADQLAATRAALDEQAASIAAASAERDGAMAAEATARDEALADALRATRAELTELVGTTREELTGDVRATREELAELVRSRVAESATAVRDDVAARAAETSAQHELTIRRLVHEIGTLRVLTTSRFDTTDANDAELRERVAAISDQVGEKLKAERRLQADALAELDDQVQGTVQEGVAKLEARLLATDHGDRQRHEHVVARLDRVDKDLGEVRTRFEAALDHLARTAEEHRTERDRLASSLEALDAQVRDLPATVERSGRDVRTALDEHATLTGKTRELVATLETRLDRIDTTLAARIPEMMGRLRLGVIELDASIEQLRGGLRAFEDVVERNDDALSRWGDGIQSAGRILEARLTESVARAAGTLVDETTGSADAVRQAAERLHRASNELEGVDETLRERIVRWERRAGAEHRALLEQLVRTLAADLPTRHRRKVAELLLASPTGAAALPADTATAATETATTETAATETSATETAATETPRAEAAGQEPAGDEPAEPEAARPEVRDLWPVEADAGTSPVSRSSAGADEAVGEVEADGGSAGEDLVAPTARSLDTDEREEGSDDGATEDEEPAPPLTIREALQGHPGVGPARLSALVDRFGTLSRLAAADPAEVAALRGISTEAAAGIVEAAGQRLRDRTVAPTS